MASRATSSDPIWLGVASPKPQPRVKQNSMFGHVVDAFDEKTIVKIGEVSPYEKRMRAKEEAERKQRELDESRSVTEESSIGANSSSASVDGRDGDNQDGDGHKNGDGSSCGDRSDAESHAAGGTSQVADKSAAKMSQFSDMSTYLVVRGGRVINDDLSTEADVLIKDGKICSVGKDVDAPGNAQVLDASGKYVLPGGIDMNTHFDVAHLDCKSLDDFEIGTKAAVYGGTTLIADCVMPEFNQSYLEAYEIWVKKAEKSFCDYVLRVALTWWSDVAEKEIETLVKDKGVNVFVLPFTARFMDAELLAIFKKLKHLECLLQVQPGIATLLSQKAEEVFKEGITGPEGCLLSYPEEIETMSIYKYVSLANQVGLPLYVTTVTSRSAAELIAEKRKEGKVVFAEVAVSSLSVDGAKILDSDWATAAAHLTTPPIRTQKNNASVLIHLLSNGDAQVVSSDHRSFGTDQRALGRNDFRLIAPGVSSVQERMEVTWSVAVTPGHMSPRRFVSVTSTFPAKLLNLYPKKGRVSVGSDADLVIFDPEKEGGAGLKGRQSKGDFNVFEGLELKGGVHAVVKDGSVVVLESGDKAAVNLKPGCLVTCSPGIEIGFEKLKLKENAFRQLTPVAREPYSGLVSGAEELNSSRTPSHAAGTRSGMEQPFCRPPTRSGGRNMQDTTLSISVEGTYADDPIKCQKLGGYRVNQPPGGRTTQFW